MADQPGPRGRCAQCGKPIAVDATNSWRPFCSERCKLIDLGRWFGGDYSIPSTPDSEEDEGRS